MALKIEVRQGSNSYLRRSEFYVVCSACSFVTSGVLDPEEAERDRQTHVAAHAEQERVIDAAQAAADTARGHPGPYCDCDMCQSRIP
jgi:hypothetical protein